MFTLFSADFIGNPGNCSYPHKTVVMNTDSMRDAVGHDYVCAEYKNHYEAHVTHYTEYIQKNPES